MQRTYLFHLPCVGLSGFHRKFLFGEPVAQAEILLGGAGFGCGDCSIRVTALIVCLDLAVPCGFLLSMPEFSLMYGVGLALLISSALCTNQVQCQPFQLKFEFIIPNFGETPASPAYMVATPLQQTYVPFQLSSVGLPGFLLCFLCLWAPLSALLAIKTKSVTSSG